VSFWLFSLDFAGSINFVSEALIFVRWVFLLGVLLSSLVLSLAAPICDLVTRSGLPGHVRSGCCAPISAWKYRSLNFLVGLRLTRSFGSCSLLDLPPQAVSSCSVVRSPNLVSRVVASQFFLPLGFGSCWLPELPPRATFLLLVSKRSVNSFVWCHFAFPFHRLSDIWSAPRIFLVRLLREPLGDCATEYSRRCSPIRQDSDQAAGLSLTEDFCCCA
jgi:hypothetical protein